MIGRFADNSPVTVAHGSYWNMPFEVQYIEDLILFQVIVEGDLDINAYVVDDDNFKLFTHNLQAIDAGADPAKLPAVEMYSSMMLTWGTLAFKPRTLGIHHLVLDNTYEAGSAKRVLIRIDRLQLEPAALRSVREAALRWGWKDVYNCFDEAVQYLSEGKFASCCDNLRRGLINLLVKVCEALSGYPVQLDPGKATDIGELKDRLGAYTPPYTIAPVTQAWSLASELSKTERRAGKALPLNQVLMACRMTFAAAAFLVSIQVSVTPAGQN